METFLLKKPQPVNGRMLAYFGQEGHLKKENWNLSSLFSLVHVENKLLVSFSAKVTCFLVTDQKQAPGGSEPRGSGLPIKILQCHTPSIRNNLMNLYHDSSDWGNLPIYT